MKLPAGTPCAAPSVYVSSLARGGRSTGFDNPIDKGVLVLGGFPVLGELPVWSGELTVGDA